MKEIGKYERKLLVAYQTGYLKCLLCEPIYMRMENRGPICFVLLLSSILLIRLYKNDWPASVAQWAESLLAVSKYAGSIYSASAKV